jgi:ferric-dicitrate binding protein FerR (iron transport regulator)
VGLRFGQVPDEGRYAAATVRGTTWDTIDRCDGTLVKVTKGSVTVRALKKKRDVVVKRGRSYFARA